MIVSKRLESLSFSTLTDKPTRRLRHEPNQNNLDNGRRTLEDRGNTPCPGIRNLESTKSRPSGTIKQKLETSRVEISGTHMIAPIYQREL